MKEIFLSQQYGMKCIREDVFIFIIYHKEETEDEDKLYAKGESDYADSFADNMTFYGIRRLKKGRIVFI